MSRRSGSSRIGRALALVGVGALAAGCGVLPQTNSSGTSPSVAATAEPAGTPATSGTPGPGGAPSSPSSSTDPAVPALASKTFTVNGTYTRSKLRIRFDVVRLERRGDLLDLRATLTNLEQDRSQDQRWQVASRFHGAYREDLTINDGAFAGAVLTDLPGKKRYFVAADSAGACVCTVGLSSTFVDAGQTAELSATYAAPPATTTTLDVAVPSLGTFRDLPIS